MTPTKGSTSASIDTPAKLAKNLKQHLKDSAVSPEIPANLLYPYVSPVTPCLHEDSVKLFLTQPADASEPPIPIIETCNPDVLGLSRTPSTRPDIADTSPMLSIVIPTVERVDGRSSYLGETLQTLLSEIERYNARVHYIYTYLGFNSTTHGENIAENPYAQRARDLLKVGPILMPSHKMALKQIRQRPHHTQFIRNLLEAPNVYQLDAHWELTSPKATSPVEHPFSESIVMPIPPGSVPYSKQYRAPFRIEVHVVAYSKQARRLPGYVKALREVYSSSLFPYLHFHAHPLEVSSTDDSGPLTFESYASLPNDASTKAWQEALERAQQYKQRSANEVPQNHRPHDILRRQTRHYAQLFEMFVRPEARFRYRSSAEGNQPSREVKPAQVRPHELPYLRSRFGLILEDDFATCQETIPQLVALLVSKLDNFQQELVRSNVSAINNDPDGEITRRYPSPAPPQRDNLPRLSPKRWTQLKSAVGGAGIAIHTSPALMPRLNETEWIDRSKLTSSYATRFTPPSEIHDAPLPRGVYFRKLVDFGLVDLAFPRTELLRFNHEERKLFIEYPKFLPTYQHLRELPLRARVISSQDPRGEATYTVVDDASDIATYLWTHQARRPVDHLMEEFFNLDTPATYFQHGGFANRMQFFTTRHRFSHLGRISSLRVQEQVGYPSCGAAVMADYPRAKSCYHYDVAPCLPPGKVSARFKSLYPAITRP